MFVFKVPCAVPVRFWLEGTWAVAVVLPPKEGTNSGTLGLRLGFSAVAAVAELWPDEGETTPSTTMGHLVGSILDRNCKKNNQKGSLEDLGPRVSFCHPYKCGSCGYHSGYHCMDSLASKQRA